MRKLLAKIRKILRDRRTRRFLTRFVSGAAAIVVFVTTYALVLPAITMEKEANCGIEAHQHDDSCYTEELSCDIPESGGHHHDESCYSITSTLICGMDEHEHSVENGCYDEDGNLICEIKEHRHNDECYEETRELTCQIPESEGHQHTDACYEKVLTCGKEAHVHSTACYEYDFVSDSAVAASTSSASAAATSAGSVSSAGMTLSFVDETVRTAGTDEQAAMDQPVDNDRAIDNNGFVDNGGLGETDGSSGSSEIGGLSETDRSSETASSGEENTEVPMEMTYGSENAGTGSTDASNAALTNADNSATALTSSTAADQYIPSLEAVDFNTVLNDRTGIYYHHVADGETVEDSSAIPAEDWNRIPNNTDNTDLMENMDDVELGGNDLLRVYLSYTIPAGSLNATNPVARYRLPSNLHLTDSQVKAINENVNGLAGQYVDLSTLEITDPDMYNAYLGVEAVEGTRRPDEAVEDYLAEQARKAGTDPDDAAEYISAVARVENVYDADGIYGEKDAYLGQDLIFTFAPYSIEKNQHEYDSKGQPTKAGQEIKGWLTLDLNIGQVDFGEAEITTSTVDLSEAGDVDGLTEDDLAEDGRTEDDRNEDEHTEDGRIEDDHTEDSRNEDGRIEDEDASEGQTEDEHNENDNNAENSVKDKENNPAGESGEDTENPRNNTVTIERSERTAEIVFVEEGWDQEDNKIDQISTRVTVVEKTVIQPQDNDTDENAADTAAENTEEPGAGNTEKSAAGSTEESVADKDADQLDKGDTDQVIMPAMSFTDSIRVSTGKPAGIDEDVEGTLGSVVRSLPQEAEVSVRVEADEGTFPAGTTMVLKAVEDLDAVAEAVTETVENSDPSVSADGADHQSEQTEDSKNNNGTEEKKNLKTYGFQAVDITFLDKDGKEIQPAKPVRVAMTSEIAEQVKEEAKTGAVENPVVVHVDDDGNAEQMELVAPEEIEPAQGKTEKELLEEDQTLNGEQEETGTTDAAGEAPSVGFTADSFSVYAIVYTVDFHWEVDGKTYESSIPGGGFASFEHLVEVLGIAGSDSQSEAVDKDHSSNKEDVDLNKVAVSEKTRAFVADVKSVEFSNPELVWVGKINEAATVGRIKTSNNLDCKYSEDLSEEQIAEINAQKVEAGDWALISMQPFSTEESLIVTMQNGDQFVIKVTDAQISANVLTADGKTFKITITFDTDAKIPAGAKLVAEELEPGSDEYYQYMGRTWVEVNKDYLEQNKQIKEGTLNEDDIKDIRPINIDESRFFNVAFMFDGKEIEPEAPVKVDIQLDEGLSNSAETPISGIVHFPKVKESDGEKTDNTTIELIENFKGEKDENGSIVEYSYELDSFSVMGAYLGQKTKDVGISAQDPSVTLPKLSALRTGDSNETLNDFEASKTLTPNTLENSTQPDGTYTLSLSVKGDVKESEKFSKTNVLIVMDRSTSMRTVERGTGVPYNGTYQSGTYYGVVGDQMPTLNYNTQTGQWTYTTYVNNYPITNVYDGQVYVEGTRLQAEQAALDELVGALAAKNTEKNPKAVEISVVSFASERGSAIEAGTPAKWDDEEHPDYAWTGASETGWETSYGSDSALHTAVHDMSMNNGTNWEDALLYAKKLADDKKKDEPDEDVYIIFMTDGMPTAIYGENGEFNNDYGAHHYTNHYNYNGYEFDVDTGGGNEYAYNFARDGSLYTNWDGLSGFTDEVRAGILERRADAIPNPTRQIVDAGYKLYNIFTFNHEEEEVGYLKRLTNFAYGNADTATDTAETGTYYTAANDIATLKQSFDNIFKAINDSLGHGKVTVVDGLTTDAMHTNIVDGQADGIRYKVEDASGNLEYTVTATGDSAEPTVTFTVGNNEYSYDPEEENNPVQKITTITSSDHVVEETTITNTDITTTVTVGGGKTTVVTKTVVSTSTDGGETFTTTTTMDEQKYNYENVEVPIPDGANVATYYSLTTDGQNYRMALAETVTKDVNNTPDDESDDERTLTWDLSPIGILKKDFTYTAEFVVWPNQKAYDYCAGLNNVAKKEAEQEEGEEEECAWNDNFKWDESAQEEVFDGEGRFLYYKGGVKEYPSIVKIPGDENTPDTYSVLSNTKQYVDYSEIHATSTNDVVTSEDEVEHHKDLKTPDPMPLTSTKTFLEKEWSAKRNLALLAQVLYNPDGTSAEFVAKFDIYKGNAYKTNNKVKPYMELSLGWDSEKEAYAWDENDVLKRVKYNGNTVYVGSRWASDFAIATGLMLSDVNHIKNLGLNPDDYATAVYDNTTYYILEIGHDYYVEEKGELGYEFDFITPVFHPMIVDGVLKNVIFEEELGGEDPEEEPAGDEPGDEPGGDEPGGDEPGGDEPGGDEPGEEEPNLMGPYHITEITDAPGGSGKLKVENKLRAYINIEKKIVDKDGKTPLPDDDTEFTYDIELTSPLDPGPFEGTHIPWYGINDLHYHTLKYETVVDPVTGEETVTETPIYTYYQAKVTNATKEDPHKSHTLLLTTESGEVYEAWRVADGNVADETDDDGTNDDGTDDESLLFDEDDAGPQWIAYMADEETEVRLQLRGNVLTQRELIDEETGETIINEETGEPEISTNHVYITIPIRQGQKLSIANVPLETSYSVTEHQEEGYNIVNIRKEIVSQEGVESRKVYTGRYGITDKVVADRDNNLIFTNKIHSTDITVRKLDEKNKPLPGAVFTLTKDQGTPAAGGETQANEWVLPAAGQADTGVYTFSGLADGTYTLKETTAPEGYKIIGEGTANEGVVATFTVTNAQITDVVRPNADDVSWSNNSLTFTVNDPLKGPGSFTVRKQWRDANDNLDAPGAKSVTLLLKRRVEKPSDRYLTVTVNAIGNNGSASKTSGRFKIVKDAVTVSWNDSGQYRSNKSRIPAPSQPPFVITDRTTNSSGNNAVWEISNLKAATEDVNVVITYSIYGDQYCDQYNNNWFYNTINGTTINITSINSSANVTFSGDAPEPDNTFEEELTLSAANRWAITKTVGGTDSNHSNSDYPAEKDNGLDYYYYIVEKTPEGSDSLPGYEPPTYSENNNPGIIQGILTATNKKTELGSLGLKKLVSFISGSGNGDISLANGKYNFTVKDQSGTVIKHVQTRYRNGLVYYKVSDDAISFDADDSDGFKWAYEEGAIVENLTPGTYTVTETDYELDNSSYGTQLVDIEVNEGNSFNLSNRTATLTVSAGDVPTAVTSYTNMLMPQMDVPVDKTWQWSDADQQHFDDKEIVSWSATFKLQYREEYYSGTPDEAQNVQSIWGYVKEGDSPKQIIISKEYDPDDPDASEENISISGTKTFENLPKFKIHANGSIYRLKYAVEEAEYTILYKDGSSKTWAKDGAHGDFDEHYAPAYDEDATHEGESISVINAPSSEREQKSIDLGIHKMWEGEDGTILPAPPDDSYSAKFKLKRYYHEEYLEVPNSGSLGLIKVTLDLGNSETMELEVPSGAPVYFTADMRTDENAVVDLVFNRTSPSESAEPIHLLYPNPGHYASTDNVVSFVVSDAIHPTANETWTFDPDASSSAEIISQYVLGGIDGVRLATFDHENHHGNPQEFPYDVTGEILDTTYEAEFDLDSENDWAKSWEKLPQIVEVITKTQKDGVEHTYLTTRVYSYYFEEIECNPPEYYAIFRDHNNSEVRYGDELSRVEISGLTIDAINKPNPETMLYKVDESNINQSSIEDYLLGGAQLTVVKYKSDAFREKDDSWGTGGEKSAVLIEGEKDGKFAVNGLVTGFYEIVETKYPDGYVQTAEKLRFKVGVNTQTEKLEIEALSENTTVRIINNYNNTGDNVIVYGNTPGAALPNSGGPGTRLFTILGSILIAGAGLLLRRRRRTL